MPSKVELGKRLKRTRTEKDMTLKDVEARSGVSATHVSQIERGMTSPTVGALEKLARALDKDMVYFLEEAELEEVSVAREPTQTMIHSENPRVVFRHLSRGIPGGKLHIGRLEIAPGGGHLSAPHAHEGEECGFVTKGQVEVRIEDRSFVLGVGEVIHFLSTRPHSYGNPGTESAEAVWVTSARGFL